MMRNNNLDPIHATGLFQYPETSGFLFSGGIERDQRHEMGKIG